MRHESRVKILFYISFTVISCSQLTFSQDFTAFKHPKKPFVIYNALAYKKSITTDSSKKLVLLQSFIPQLFVEFIYASKQNFTRQILYKNPAAFARLPVALALKEINEELNKMGLGLKIFDAYRPYSATKKMWKIVHDERYVANPATGSGHNRGISVDVTLVNLSTKEEVNMPTQFDDFTEKAHHNYRHLSEEVLANRALLKTLMEAEGFVALPTEWWHYSMPNTGSKFELLDLDFDLLRKLTSEEK